MSADAPDTFVVPHNTVVLVLDHNEDVWAIHEGMVDEWDEWLVEDGDEANAPWWAKKFESFDDVLYPPWRDM